MALVIEIKETQPDEYRLAADTVGMSLLFAPVDDENWDKQIASWAASDSLSAWDRGQCVGHVGSYPVDTVVPGGARLPTSAVARVGVLPTHRRRGLASNLVRRSLQDAAARGQVLASLRASEGLIYGRFGFGIAGDAAEITLDPAGARPIRGAASGSMRMLARDETLDVVAPLYERSATRPGTITRPEWMWKRYLAAALTSGGDAEYVAVHSDADGIDDGFVHYGVKWKMAPATEPRGEGEVYDAFGTSTAVELAIWSYLCDLDLVRTWTAEERPIDDPLRLAVHDPRSYQVKMLYDEQWLRLIDVDTALSARIFGEAAEGVTIAVDDDLFPANNGVWRIETKGTTRDERDPADADLRASASTLAACYLGGVRWSALAAVGRVDVRDESALPLADQLFLQSPAPFCGSHF